jgi:orotate phosphoribosyltransferase-like protein
MKYLTPALFGIMLSGGLIAASAMTALTASHNSQVQHLTVAEASSTEQSAQSIDALIGIAAFGVPCSLLFAILLQNQLAAQQTKLAAQLVRVRVKSK